MITTMHSDQNASPPRVEVITSVQRRRRWPTAEKIRLVEETLTAGDVGVLRGPASGRRSQLAVQLARICAPRRVIDAFFGHGRVSQGRWLEHWSPA